MLVAKFETVVRGKNIIHTFRCDVHRTESPADRLMEVSFYEKASQPGVPQGVHYEMEIMEPTSTPYGLPVHIHVNPASKRRFLCWTGSLPTEDSAWNLFQVWSIGTAYTLETKKDFGALMLKDVEKFKELMAHDHNIKLTSAFRGG